jgi:SH3 domain-containing protein
LPRSSTTQRVPSPTTSDLPLGTPRIATRSAPRVLSGPPPPNRRVEGPAPPTRLLNRFVGSPRALIAALVLLALLPNLTVAAFVWLPALWAPEAKVEEPVRVDATGAPDARPKETAKLAPALTVPSILEANAGEDVVLPITLDGTDGVPFRSAIAISGLPAGATLSGGRPYGATGWNLKPDEIGDLHLVLPDAARGETRLAIQLVDSAGEIVAAAETTLRVAAKPEPVPPAPPPINDPSPVSTEAQAGQAPQNAATNTDGKPDGAQALNTVDEDPAPSAANDRGEQSAQNRNADAAKLAPSDDAQTEKDGAAATSVQPSTSVNLREGPTSSAAVISVIAKDTKLTVLEQRRRWVKVVNPESSESGWIYAPNLDGLAKSRDWSGQSSHADEPSEPRESIWKRMRNWLTGG